MMKLISLGLTCISCAHHRYRWCEMDVQDWPLHNPDTCELFEYFPGSDESEDAKAMLDGND